MLRCDSRLFRFEQVVENAVEFVVVRGARVLLWRGYRRGRKLLDAIGEAIGSIETAPFLSAEQKRDILYDNAARFLRLTPAQVAADHAGAAR